MIPFIVDTSYSAFVFSNLLSNIRFYRVNLYNYFEKAFEEGKWRKIIFPYINRKGCVVLRRVRRPLEVDYFTIVKAIDRLKFRSKQLKRAYRICPHEGFRYLIYRRIVRVENLLNYLEMLKIVSLIALLVNSWVKRDYYNFNYACYMLEGYGNKRFWRIVGELHEDFY